MKQDADELELSYQTVEFWTSDNRKGGDVFFNQLNGQQLTRAELMARKEFSGNLFWIVEKNYDI